MWSDSKTGNLSLKEAYLHKSHIGQKSNWAKKVWTVDIPLPLSLSLPGESCMIESPPMTNLWKEDVQWLLYVAFVCQLVNLRFICSSNAALLAIFGLGLPPFSTLIFNLMPLRISGRSVIETGPLNARLPLRLASLTCSTPFGFTGIRLDITTGKSFGSQLST